MSRSDAPDPVRRRLLATGGAALVGGTILGRFTSGRAAEAEQHSGWRPPAHEIALLLSGFAHDGVPNAVMAWNGVAGYYSRYPIKVPAGERVRGYVMNMTSTSRWGRSTSTPRRSMCSRPGWGPGPIAL